MSGKAVGSDVDEDDYDYITPGDLVECITPAYWIDRFDITKPKNFYKVYGALFDKLDAEEEDAEQHGTDHVNPRPFGDPGTHIEDVIAFYKHWNSFSTKKTFGYKDKYKAS